MDFPITAKPDGSEDVVVTGPGFSFRLCAHGARELSRILLEAVERQRCDGYRHGDASTMFLGTKGEPAITYTFERTKKLSELRASDVPRGMDPDDMALPDDAV